jgi:hypothetical protein
MTPNCVVVATLTTRSAEMQAKAAIDRFPAVHGSHQARTGSRMAAVIEETCRRCDAHTSAGDVDERCLALEADIFGRDAWAVSTRTICCTVSHAAAIQVYRPRRVSY